MQKTQIALFPLQLFLLPGEVAELYIFEPRYKQLIEDCELVNMSFGIPYSKNGYLTEYGCLVNLKRVLKRYGDGSCDIEVEASEIFKVRSYSDYLDSKLYPGGEVEVLSKIDKIIEHTELIKRLEKYFRNLQSGIVTQLSKIDLSLFAVCRILMLSDSDKLNLIKRPSHKSREDFLINHLKFLDLLRLQKNAVKGDVFLN